MLTHLRQGGYSLVSMPLLKMHIQDNEYGLPEACEYAKISGQYSTSFQSI